MSAMPRLYYGLSKVVDYLRQVRKMINPAKTLSVKAGAVLHFLTKGENVAFCVEVSADSLIMIDDGTGDLFQTRLSGHVVDE